MSEHALAKTLVISELTRSPHGALADYLPIGRQAAAEDPEFFAHLVAWNHLRGQVKDAQVALPVIALATAAALNQDPVFLDNALAHLVLSDVRLRATKQLPFARDAGVGMHLRRRLVARALREMETNPGKWTRVALQHRRTLKGLYATYRVKPGPLARSVLFKETFEPGSPFAALAALRLVDPATAGSLIVQHRLPYLSVRGALGSRLKAEPVLLAAVVQAMTPNELVTNTKGLERLGLRENVDALAAYMAGLRKEDRAPRAVLKATRAADALEASGTEDGAALATELRAAQERKLDALRGIEGNWLVLGDKSPSMGATVETARQVAAVLARLVKGTVSLAFFDSVPRFVDVTGKTLEQLRAETRLVVAGGDGTSIGCGLQALLDRKVVVDGIAIISDGGENRAPAFAETYTKYKAALGVEPTVYWYQTLPDDPRHQSVALSREIVALRLSMVRAGVDLQHFDLTAGVDYYALPNLVQTMRVGRYQLLDEILATPLLTLDGALPLTRGERVLPVVARPIEVLI